WGSGPNDLWTVGTNKVTHGGVLFHKTTDTWVQFGTSKYGLRSVWGTATQRFAVGLSGAIYSGPIATPFAIGNEVDPNGNVPLTPDAPILYSVSGNGDTAAMVAGDVDSTFFYDTRWHALADPVDRTRAFRAMWGAPGD